MTRATTGWTKKMYLKKTSLFHRYIFCVYSVDIYSFLYLLMNILSEHIPNMPRNWQSLLNFFSRLEIVLLSNSKLFFVLSQMFDKRKIYSNVGYLISLRSAINFKQYALLWVISIAMRFQYDEGIGKVWMRFEFTNYCACAQGQNIAISVFRKKNEKGNRKGKNKHLLFLWDHSII